ncbi:MAG: hypothetical protein R2759_04185 [Bacteroidales bacterium]
MGYLDINPALDFSYPVAYSDTVKGIPNYMVEVNVLKNDYNPSGRDPTSFLFPSEEKITLSKIVVDNIYNRYYSVYGIKKEPRLSGDYGVGLLIVDIEHNNFYSVLDINNINARFNCFGNHFEDYIKGDETFYVPANTNKRSCGSNALWFAGLDENGTVHASAEMERINGKEFSHGPVSNQYDSLFDVRWYHAWKLNRSDIEFHQANWWKPGYVPLDDILTWPGNGDTDNGQLDQIAPFFDLNENGIYEPMLGDAPHIKGDQAVYFVYNDVREEQHFTQGENVGVEVHGMAYGYDMPEDSALWNTIFVHYDIINRFNINYHDFSVGNTTYIDLGFDLDNYIESDVQNSMYFAFNGSEIDGDTFSPEYYGYHPPAQGVILLGGPYLDDDGADNPRFDNLGNPLCDYSFNGLNFGDGIIDNERYGMTNFLMSRDLPWYGNTYTDIECYHALNSIWKDHTHLLFGKNGHVSASAPGPEAKYFCPRNSDPVNWGTNGVWPNGGYNQNGFYWSGDNEGIN